MATKPAPKFETIKGMYSRLWKEADIKPGWRPALEKVAKRILANRDKYETVSATTGVPWFVIAILHMRESSCDFTKHLHEGSPLSDRTRKIPKGHPKKGNPPFTWEESAYDALVNVKHLDRIKVWTIEQVCYVVEQYNGWGYYNYHSRTLSPYLWQGTDHYADADSAAGKYVDDGKWDGNVVDQQCGAIAVLKVLMELDPSIELDEKTPLRDKLSTPVAKLQVNGTVAAILAGIYYLWDWFVWIIANIASLFGLLPNVADSVTATIGASQQISTHVGIPLPTKFGLAVAAVCFVVAVVAYLKPSKVN